MCFRVVSQVPKMVSFGAGMASFFLRGSYLACHYGQHVITARRGGRGAQLRTRPRSEIDHWFPFRI
jgi:hypothetical protein